MSVPAARQFLPVNAEGVPAVPPSADTLPAPATAGQIINVVLRDLAGNYVDASGGGGVTASFIPNEDGFEQTVTNVVALAQTTGAQDPPLATDLPAAGAGVFRGSEGAPLTWLECEVQIAQDGGFEAGMAVHHLAVRVYNADEAETEHVSWHWDCGYRPLPAGETNQYLGRFLVPVRGGAVEDPIRCESELVVTQSPVATSVVATIMMRPVTLAAA